MVKVGLHQVKKIKVETNRGSNRIQIISEEKLPDTPKENAWDILESLAGTFEAPEDWSIQHDYYLYATPKHNLSNE
ncbi:MAG: hypothetical protein F6K22_10065 [Okeania sp. SIO2F4]|nr:hypothetical protein [Okeania sp. SIO2F4]